MPRPEDRHLSPLRYPGGKSKLTNFVKALFRMNDLMDGEYAEPYAGGSSVALGLVIGEYASVVHINDLDRSIFSFWYAVLNETEALCRRISRTRVNVCEWRRQREVQDRSASAELLDLAFSTFFLNRTNRSGIIAGGGIIGGEDQTGEWAIDARYNKMALIKRIERIARYRERISLTQLDARAFLVRVVRKLPEQSLTYLDPPYFVKGQRLYANYYRPEDHANIAKSLASTNRHWIVSYDNAPEIQVLYGDYDTTVYGLRYTAAKRYDGREIMVFSPGLEVPNTDPSKLTDDEVLSIAC
jgi:DNA adenine methylase